MNGIRFYNVVWETGSGYTNTTEGALSFRNMKDILKRGEVEYYNEDGSAWNVVKVQEIETPMIEIEWLLDLFTKSGTAKSREAHRDQAAYVLRLVERCAARVKLENGDFIER